MARIEQRKEHNVALENVDLLDRVNLYQIDKVQRAEEEEKIIAEHINSIEALVESLRTEMKAIEGDEVELSDQTCEAILRFQEKIWGELDGIKETLKPFADDRSIIKWNKTELEDEVSRLQIIMRQEQTKIGRVIQQLSRHVNSAHLLGTIAATLGKIISKVSKFIENQRTA